MSKTVAEIEGHASAASFLAWSRCTCPAKAFALVATGCGEGKLLSSRYLRRNYLTKFRLISKWDESNNAHYCTFAACHCRRVEGWQLKLGMFDNQWSVISEPRW